MGLVNVPPHDGAYVLVAVDDLEELVRVFQSYLIEPAAAHAHRMMVQAHESVRSRILGQRTLQQLQLRRRKPSACLASDEAVEHHCEPARPARNAAELKRRAVQRAGHRDRFVVIAGNAVDRYSERGEDFAKSRVALGIVLDEIAGSENAVARPMLRAGIVDGREERGVGGYAAELAVGI